MPKERITDERTGQSCDYTALTSECCLLAQTEGISWRQAAERIAQAANPEKSDSIVRQLNRKRPNAKPPLPILPGEAVLYDAIDKQLDHLETRLSGPRAFSVSDILSGSEGPFTPDRPFAEMAAQAASIRALLQHREDTLKTLTEEEAIRGAVSVLHGVEQGPLSPHVLVQTEHGRLSRLIVRVRQLQNKIQAARPGPYIIETY